jgi:hypothetical protein
MCRRWSANDSSVTLRLNELCRAKDLIQSLVINDIAVVNGSDFIVGGVG